MDRPTRYLLMADGKGDALRLRSVLGGAPGCGEVVSGGRRPAGPQAAGAPLAAKEEVVWVRSFLGAAGVLRQGNVEAVLLEAGFSGCRAIDVLKLLSDTASDIPLILLSTSEQLPVAMAAVRWGAHDYLLKSTLDDADFRQRLDFCVERFATARATARRLQDAQAQLACFRSLVHDNDDGMLVLDLQGYVQFANPAAADLFQRKPTDLIGSHVEFPIDDGDAREIVIGRHRSGDTVADLRLARTTWDGEPAMLATLRDISLRKRTERALLLAKQQAELASEMKSRFLASMSHELRTPLNSILGFAEMMQKGVFGRIENPRYEDYLATIHHAGQHLLTLINNLLDLSKIEAGREELDETVVDIHELLRAAVHAEEPTAHEHGVVLRCEVSGPPRLLRADPVKLDQIVLNLLSNAVKFTPEGGQVTLTGEMTPLGGYRITVADTGCGMDKAEISQAMGLFIQVRSPHARSRDRGTGLGLPIARGLAELHGGTLELSSQRGLGTQVVVNLPPARVLDSPLARLEASQPVQRRPN